MRANRGQQIEQVAQQAESPLRYPATLHIQPTPVAVDVVRTSNSSGWLTVIARDWASPADAARCRLCPLGQCTARGRDHCAVGYNRFVSDQDAPLYAGDGAEWPTLAAAQ